MLSKLNLKGKLILMGVTLAVLPLVVSLMLSYRAQLQVAKAAQDECLVLGKQNLDDIAQGVYDLCALEHAQLAERAASSLDVGSQALRQAIMDLKIAETGYVFVLDSAGNYVISAGGKRDGENIWGAKDADGVLFIQEYIRKATSAAPGKFVEQDYPWKNKGDNEARMKIARGMHFEPWDWVIGASSYEDEFLKGNRRIEGIRDASGRVAFLVAALAVLIATGSAWLFSKRITKPIFAAVEVARSVSRGDLSHRLHNENRDEIGQLSRALDRMSDGLQDKAAVAEAIAAGDLTSDVAPAGAEDSFGNALKGMTDQLNEVLSGIRSAAERVGTGSREIADSSTSLSQGATEQAASLQEISASMTELNSQVKLNAESAGQADQLSDVARDAAATGVDQMREMTVAMGEINGSSEEIAKIIKVIDDIAFQTNLLALNAAVEAARAGKHGKGFAVVAEEVRNLAGRSAKAARETSELIEGSLTKVKNGTEIAARTATSLESIVETVTQASDLVGEIASASNEQAQGITEVSQGLTQIDSVTQQNTANSEETASAAQELSGEAETLHSLMQKFRLKTAPNPVGQAAAPEQWSAPPVQPIPAGEPDRQVEEIIELSSDWG